MNYRGAAVKTVLIRESIFDTLKATATEERRNIHDGFINEIVVLGLDEYRRIKSAHASAAN